MKINIAPLTDALEALAVLLDNGADVNQFREGDRLKIAVTIDGCTYTVKCLWSAKDARERAARIAKIARCASRTGFRSDSAIETAKALRWKPTYKRQVRSAALAQMVAAGETENARNYAAQGAEL